MFNARYFIPLSPAFAVGTSEHVGGGLPCTGALDRAHRTPSFPICRDVLR